jgi:protein-tyrosine phosphatase
VTAVLDLTAEFTEAKAFRSARYRNLPLLDLTAPTQDQLQEAVAFLAAEAAAGTVYLHCKIGYSRSAAVAGAYLLATGIADTAEEAVAHLRRARPSIVVRPEAREALRVFAARPRTRGRRGERQAVPL